MLPSLMTFFNIGPGPSSSHTIGPYKAAISFLKDLELLHHEEGINIEVTLYGSLALTGKGHMTDVIILQALQNYHTQVIFNIEEKHVHPNTLTFRAYSCQNKLILKETFVSIGGGQIVKEGETAPDYKPVYPFSNFAEMQKYLEDSHKSLRDMVLSYEGSAILSFLDSVWNQMKDTIKLGLVTQGEVAGPLHVQRVAGDILKKSKDAKEIMAREQLKMAAYAYATAECNAAGNLVVTAPTCGSSGVVPAILFYEACDQKASHAKIIDGLMMAGLVGEIVRKNATISGAIGGCQAEIGTATAMAAAAISELKGLSPYQVGYGAEIAMEHSLGLTCDPIGGYVAIPCIERNAISVLKAYDCYLFAKNIAPIRKNRISFDNSVEVMYETGLSLRDDFKETSKGGLAKVCHS